MRSGVTRGAQRRAALPLALRHACVCIYFGSGPGVSCVCVCVVSHLCVCVSRVIALKNGAGSAVSEASS
jgi:hypothetical protein